MWRESIWLLLGQFNGNQFTGEQTGCPFYGQWTVKNNSGDENQNISLVQGAINTTTHNTKLQIVRTRYTPSGVINWTNAYSTCT